MTKTVVIKGVNNKPVTAGQLLFKKPFKVSMATVDTLDENDIRERGMFTTGYADIDLQLAKRPSQVWRTIAEMTELWHEGIEFTLVFGMDDAEKINDLIQQHITDCTWYHEHSLKSMRREDPAITRQRLEDLKLFDDFGRQIYNKVRLHGKDIVATGVEKLLQDDAPLLGADVFGQTKIGSRRNGKDYVGVEERIDYSALKKRSRYRK